MKNKAQFASKRGSVVFYVTKRVASWNAVLRACWFWPSIEQFCNVTISGVWKVYTNIHNTLIFNEIKPALSKAFETLGLIDLMFEPLRDRTIYFFTGKLYNLSRGMDATFLDVLLPYQCIGDAIKGFTHSGFPVHSGTNFSKWGSSLTLSCSFGSVRAITTTHSSVSLELRGRWGVFGGI